jgi:glycosyltransferase involved in cell wall biosynthesis
VIKERNLLRLGDILKLLAVSYDYPQPDQSSGELRFFTLLSLLTQHGDVAFWSRDQQASTTKATAATKLQAAGVSVRQGTFEHVLRQQPYDVVIFEFYFVAEPLIELVRAWQPQARIVVDTVDVHFHRLESKARLSGAPADVEAARATRAKELDVYGKADVVVAVSEADREVLQRAGLRAPVVVLPNVHVMHPLQPRVRGERLEIVFVGSYKWAPNVDAMVYFCTEVLPHLRKRVPRLRLRIIGSAPTDEVCALACDDVEVVGFVDDTTPYLSSSDVSVAPLRYGGGIKGKVGEALAHGLPVVTTPVGAEGFGFVNGEHVLVGHTPQELADLIAELWLDQGLCERVRTAGWRFIEERLSTHAVARRIPGFLASTLAARPRRLSTVRRMRMVGPHWFQRHVGWRFR